MKSKYTVKIDAENTFYRFAYADEPLEREEQYSGDVETGVYLPYLKDFDLSDNSVELEGGNSIPEISMEVYDPTNEIYDNLRERNLDYETLEAVVHKLQDGGSYQKVFDGYLTDVSDSDAAFISMTIRKSEKQNVKNIFDRFSYDSFQKIVTRHPSSVRLDPVWSATDEMGWELAKGYTNATDEDPSWVAYSRRFAMRSEKRDGNIEKGDTSFSVSIPQNTDESATGNGYHLWTYSSSEDKLYQDGYTDLFPNSGEIAIGFPNSASFEIVSYSSLTVGRNTNGWHTVITFEGIEHDGSSGVSEHHRGLTPIRPVNNNTASGDAPIDEVWVNTHGKLPVDENKDLIDDPNIDAGFINIGGAFSEENGISYRLSDRNIDGNIEKISDDIFPLFRYEIDKNHVYGKYAKLKIHSVVEDDNFHDLAVDHPATQYPLPSLTLGDSDGESEPDDKVYNAKFRWVVRQMDFKVKNISGTEIAQSTDNFEDELRGVRIDLEGEFDNYDIVRDGGLNKTEEDYKQVNKNLVNNATEKFGVVSGSEVVKSSNGNYVTRLYFDLPDSLMTSWRPVITDSDEVPNIDDADHYKSVDPDKDIKDVFMNYLVYEPTYQSLTEIKNDPNSELLQHDAAERFFLTKRYRYFLKPVPRGSQDLGKVFPIVYGYVQKVPMLHVTSKMRFDQGEETAGDDHYVYAGHPCDVYDASDITIHYMDNDRQETPSKTSGRKTPAEDNSRIYYEIAKNPFPKVVENHYEEYDASVTDIGGTEEYKGVRSVGKIETPYHALKEMETINDESVKGVQLQGHKWNSSLGRLDVRFPVRNGFGTSTLYGSFGGYTSQGNVDVPEGELIEHPLDIIYHFVMKYGRYEGVENTAERLFDMENIGKVKAKTRKYKFGVYIDEEVTLFDLISKICKQAGFYWYFGDGKIKFSLGEKGVVQKDKPIVEGLNVVGEVSQESEGYKDFYDEVRYEYEKDYINDGYKKEVLYNGLNNELCARSSKVLAETNAFEVQADWIYSTHVAKDVARRYVERLCSRRFTYNVKVKKGVGGIDEFELLDYVPITAEEYGLDRTPVLVTAVNDEPTFQDLTVVEFRDS